MRYYKVCGTFPDFNIFAVEFSKLFMLNISKMEIGSGFPLPFFALLFSEKINYCGKVPQSCCSLENDFCPTIHEISNSIVVLE